MYEVGEVYNFSGVNRKVVGFDGQGRPITEPTEGEATSSLSATPDYKNLLALIPLDEHSNDTLFGIISFMGVELPPKEDGKEHTKSELISAIMGA